MTLYYIFDLDGTLYSFKHTGIGRQMRVLINNFVSEQWKMTLEEADAFSDHAYKHYGLTARGIQVEKQVSQFTLKKYCGYVHQVDDSHIQYNRELVNAFQTLAQIPGVQLWIMTNAIRQHALASLAQMGITESFRDPISGQVRIVDCFDQWAASTRDHEAICKPLVESYDFMVKRVLGADPANDKFVMIEDSVRNLEEPQKMGWKTVFLTDEREEMVAPAKAHGHVVHANILDAVPDLLLWAKTEECSKKESAREE